MFDDLPIAIPTGFVRNETANSAKGRWREGNLVRFFKGRAERWLGWQYAVSGQTLGAPARGGISWVSLGGLALAAFGTYEGLFVVINGAIYDITPADYTPGLNDSIVYSSAIGVGGGVGDGPIGGSYSAGSANSGRATTWTLDLWGEDLVACPRSGKIYHWSPNYIGPTPPPATIVPDSPATNLGIFVTENRFLVSYGSHDGSVSDPMLVRWASRETRNVWTPLETNTAGSLRAQRGNEIVGAIKVSAGTLIITDASTYFFQYIGSNYVFGMPPVDGNNGMIAPHAGVQSDGEAIFMGDKKFYAYGGRVLEVDCDVHKYVFDDINLNEAHKIACGTNRKYGEVIWFYPSKNSREPDRYVAVNKDGWSCGKLSRSTWIDDDFVVKSPLAVGPDGTIYRHDVGELDPDGNPIEYFLESGEIVLEDGAKPSAGQPFTTSRKFIPDFEPLIGNHVVSFIGRDYPMRAGVRTKTYAFDASKDVFGVRLRSATFRIRFSGDGYFRMGVPRLSLTGSGGKQT